MDDIYKWLEDKYVGVMAMRYIGPIQWTRSSNLQSDENDKTACKRAEILNELLHSDKINDKLEEMYHQSLTFPFKFMNTKDGIYVKNTKKDADPFPLLKCPEGIMEAKQLTLILAHKEFLTITLEEPDVGKHPHMIKKMRDLILRNVKGKTVLIITHNTSMVNQWSMSRSFIFSKINENDSVSHTIRKVPAKGWKKYGRNKEMKCVLFSPRVFFVEGITDKLVFEAIFSFLTTNSKSPIAKNPELKDYLLASEVMELQSASHGKAKTEMCNTLMKETFVLYDFEQFTTCNHCKAKCTSPNMIKVCGCKANVDFRKEYMNIKDFLKNYFHELEKACEHSNVFCWKGGDLEDQIMKILDKLNYNVSRRIAGDETNEKRKKKIIKDNIPDAKSTDIDRVTEALVQHLEEMTRFIHFLEKISKTDTLATIEKRKALNEDDTVTDVHKRQKSNDSGDEMSVDYTKDSRSFQRPELRHSGVSETIEPIDLDC